MNRKLFPAQYRIALLTTALIALLGSAAAAAQTAPLATGADAPTSVPTLPTFQRLDSNRDGFLSLEETRGLRDFEGAFTEADDNRDNRLDADEFVKAQAIYERQRMGRVVGDGVITVKVKAALLKDPVVSAFAVNVDTYKGTVQLSGFVNSEQQVRRAAQVAAGIDGVVDVKNHLIVKS